jgi:hypothetical protein
LGICLYIFFGIRICGAREMADPRRNPAPQGPGAGVSQAQPQTFSASGAQGQAPIIRAISDIREKIWSPYPERRHAFYELLIYNNYVSIESNNAFL